MRMRPNHEDKMAAPKQRTPMQVPRARHALCTLKLEPHYRESLTIVPTHICSSDPTTPPHELGIMLLVVTLGLLTESYLFHNKNLLSIQLSIPIGYYV
jgi:hypothetical protein